MNSTLLFAKFSQGVNWNGIFYFLYKTFSTILSFILFGRLTHQEFSTWANINSIIFLGLLWIDLGLRKAIPRYASEFAKDPISHKRFIRTLILFQTLLLLATTPIIALLLKGATNLLQLNNQHIFLYCGASLFFIEGMINILRLIYHAHFWNKQFNQITTAMLLAEILIIATILCYASTSLDVLRWIFITKLCLGTLLIIVTLMLVSRLYKDQDCIENGSINYHKTFKEFIQHSGIMWINTNLKSLSERNVLVPFFTYTLGAPLANLFKIANDGALFFYRIALKTIGTTDTTLLSYVQNSNEEEKLMPIAFQKLTSKIAALCIPLLGILLVLFFNKQLFFKNTFVFQTFFIMVVGYVSELLFSAYERVLEIKRRYLLLMIAYIPYIIMLILLLYYNTISYLGLISSLLIIHGVRLVSSLSMTIFARKEYPLLRYSVSPIHIYRGVAISMGVCILLSLAKQFPVILSFIRSVLR